MAAKSKSKSKTKHGRGSSKRSSSASCACKCTGTKRTKSSKKSKKSHKSDSPKFTLRKVGDNQYEKVAKKGYEPYTSGGKLYFRKTADAKSAAKAAKKPKTASKKSRKSKRSFGFGDPAALQAAGRESAAKNNSTIVPGRTGRISALMAKPIDVNSASGEQPAKKQRTMAAGGQPQPVMQAGNANAEEVMDESL